MSWISTSYTTRKELVESIIKNYSKSITRGNFIWIVNEQELFYFEIRKETTWEYRKVNEVDFSSETSCPISLLNISNEQNPTWRSSLKQKKENQSNLGFEIKKTFDLLNDNQQLIIQVKTLTFGIMEFIVEKKVPLLGRNNGKLYRIPLRRIYKWYIQSL